MDESWAEEQHSEGTGEGRMVVKVGHSWSAGHVGECGRK